MEPRARSRLSRWGAALALLLWAAAARAAEDLGGGYQGESVKSFGRGSSSLWQTIRETAADLDLTRAKVLIGVGVIGAVFTLNKNKRLFHWGAVAALSYAFVGLGAAALYFGWPSFN